MPRFTPTIKVVKIGETDLNGTGFENGSLFNLPFTVNQS